MKILIVDDDVALLDVIRRQVNWNELGFGVVLTAQNGEQAKTVIAGEHPDVVLSDISMPLCSGIDLIRYVREKGIGCEFAFLTCYAEMSYMREAMRYGAKWYLTKPVNFPELERELAEIAETVRKKGRPAHEEPPEDRLVAVTVFRGLRDGLYGEDRELVEATLQNHHLDIHAEDEVVSVGIRINRKQEEGSELRIRPICLLARRCIAGKESLENMLIDPEENKLSITLFLRVEDRSQDELLSGCRSFIRCVQDQFSLAPVCVVGPPESFQAMAENTMEQKRYSGLDQAILEIWPAVSRKNS